MKLEILNCRECGLTFGVDGVRAHIRSRRESNRGRRIGDVPEMRRRG